MTTSPCSWGECAAVRPDPNGGVWLSSTRRPGVEVLLDAGEWVDFLARVRAGEFDANPQVNDQSALAGKKDHEGELA